MTRTKLTAEQMETEFIRAECSLKDALSYLDITLQRLTRLYPDQEHEYHQAIRTIHEDTAGLFVALSHEYGQTFNQPTSALMRMARREQPWPVELAEKETVAT